jgi:phosphoglycerate dehydrogenase-like enzyme
VLTPHIGASTHEAQARAGVLIAEKVIGFFKQKKLL